MLQNFFLVFIPIFVAVDAIGILPIFVSLTDGLEAQRKKQIVRQSFWTALLLAVGFILLGKMVFQTLGITIGDFMVAGGIILFVISIIDLLFPGKERRIPHEDLGAVPIGTPLIVGPAVLTTSLISIDQHGLILTIAAVFINLLLVGIVFSFSDRLIKILGQSGSKTLSKIMSLLLAAIAIKMIRSGIYEIVSSYPG